VIAGPGPRTATITGMSSNRKRPRKLAPLETHGASPRMREALRALEADPLATPASPQGDRLGEIEVTLVGKVLSKRRRR
jgi:hypothetical protein